MPFDLAWGHTTSLEVIVSLTWVKKVLEAPQMLSRWIVSLQTHLNLHVLWINKILMVDRDSTRAYISKKSIPYFCKHPVRRSLEFESPSGQNHIWRFFSCRTVCLTNQSQYSFLHCLQILVWKCSSHYLIEVKDSRSIYLAAWTLWSLYEHFPDSMSDLILAYLRRKKGHLHLCSVLWQYSWSRTGCLQQLWWIFTLRRHFLLWTSSCLYRKGHIIFCS